MPQYEITDNVSGKTLVITGDSPPTEQEAEELFQGSGVRNQEQVQPQGQPQQGLLPQVANFLMPNVVKYGQNALQELGAGNVQPGAIGNQTRVVPQASPQQQGMDVLMSALGPGAQQMAGFMGIGSPLENQKNMGARELAQTLQLAKSAAGGIQGALTKTGETIQNVAGAKSINPWKVTGYGRERAMQEAGKLDTSSMIKAGDEFVKKNPMAEKAWETFKPTITKDMDATDLVGRMTDIFGKAYTKTGDIRQGAESDLLGKLYQAGKAVIADQAPKVAQYTKNFKDLRNAPIAIQKASWLALKMTALGKLLGLN